MGICIRHATFPSSSLLAFSPLFTLALPCLTQSWPLGSGSGPDALSLSSSNSRHSFKPQVEMDRDDGWEEAALNTRHMHNRNDRGGRGNVRESFQIRNTFGTHLVKCAALERLQGTQSGPGSSKPGEKSKQAGPAGKKKGSRSNSGSGDVVLEIYRLTDDEDGILGSLKYPGVFEAAVVFAGSRKLLGNITRHLSQDDAVEDTPYGTRRGSLGSSSSKSLDQRAGNAVNGDAEEEDEDDDEDEDEESSGDEEGLSSHENRQRRRLATFEKNSFRQPKFWFRWQGVVSEDALAGLEDLELKGGKVHGSGYVVFSGNDCRRFQGTMTSEQLGWNNVKMTGWKAKPQPERDFEIQWSRES